MTEGVQVAALCGVSIALIALAIWIVMRVHGTPEKRERKRRLNVHRQGRLGDAMISEATESTLYYFYTVRGVQYTASQDVSALREYLPADPDRLIGVSGLKYSSKNPANSILVCEEWSGLRAPAVKEEASSPSGTDAENAEPGARISEL
ncbi:MAG TPA: hypothetical protein VK752_09575 [Bryobacteraceae bacterium]|jgi:hypothetical protein|nr:hypothetical protein [Bryobacteraceae bacterium]